MNNKGTEILKQVHFTASHETARKHNMEYSDKYIFMQVLIDWNKRELITFLKSREDIKLDRTNIEKF